MSVGCRAQQAWWRSPPPPSPCRRWESSGFRRLKAKLLESLCFYPPICSHLAGLGGGAARARLRCRHGGAHGSREPVLCPCSDSSGLQGWTPAGGRAGRAWPAGKPAAGLPAAPRAPELPTRATVELGPTDGGAHVPATTSHSGPVYLCSGQHQPPREAQAAREGAHLGRRRASDGEGCQLSFLGCLRKKCSTAAG